MKLKYEPALDGLRALAAIAVLLHHTDARAFAGGEQGVDVFFVLSGYLITRILAASEASIGDFWMRRLRRLYPALLFFGFTFAGLMIAAHQPPTGLAAALTYSSDIPLSLGADGGLVLHTWSLAVEMQFYLVWPFALRAMLRSPRPPALPLLCVWCALTIARIAFLKAGGSEAFAYFSPFSRCSGLILGSAVAFVPSISRRWAFVGLVGLAAYLTISAVTSLNQLAYGVPVVETCAALILRARPGVVARWLSVWPLVNLGLISYGIYLWHFPVAVILKPYPWWIAMCGEVAIAIPMAWLSYVTVERWTRTPARRPSLTVVASITPRRLS